MRSSEFEKVIAAVRTENTSCLKQLDNLYYSKGDFTADQVGSAIRVTLFVCKSLSVIVCPSDAST